VSVSVSVNGRARSTVMMWRRGTEDTLLVDEANIASSKGRAALVEQLEAPLRADAAALLEQLAIRVTHAREIAADAPAGEAGPFPHVVPWGAYPGEGAVDAEEILDDLCALFGQYVILPPHAAEAIALWVVHTHVTDVAEYTPYILVTSPVRECGKTTLLELLVHLAYRAQFTGGITAAALYRRIDRLSPTMLLDELDTRLRGDAGEMLRGVLNTGFQRSGRVTICVGEDHEERDFSTFGPKVLSGIGRVWNTVTSRSIPIRLARASKAQLGELRKIRGDTIGRTCLPYQRRIRRWTDEVTETLRVTDPVLPRELSARQCDVWRPLLAIADTVSVTWGKKARAAALALHGLAEEEGDYGLLMLQDVQDIFKACGTDAVFTSTILEVLCAREDRPWPEYRHDRPITPRGVASLLGRFGVKPGSVRVGADTGKGYKLEALAPVFRTYLGTLDPSVTSVTNAGVTDVTDRNQGVSVRDDGVIRHPDGSQELTPARLAELQALQRGQREALHA
jgi:hypothetical protein